MPNSMNQTRRSRRISTAMVIIFTQFFLNRQAMSLCRNWWARPIFINRNEYGNRLLGTIMQEDFVESTLNFLRMTKTMFDHLLGLVETRIKKQDTNMRRAITPKERLLVTLRYLATGSSYASLAFLFRVSTDSIRKIVPEVCCAISEVLQEYVKLPSTADDWKTISKGFETRFGFPHAIGAIDGKHVRIQAPKNSGSEYFNYKGYFSIVLLAVTDANYNIIYADVGSKGRISDSGVFKQCSLFPLLENKRLNIPPPQVLGVPYTKEVPFVLLGDKAFPLSEYLLRPFGGTHDHGSPTRLYNLRHAKARCPIENVFGILRSRFRIFDSAIALDPDVAKQVVLATVYLHNFLRKHQSEDAYMTTSNERDIQNRNGSTANVLAGLRIRSSNELMEMRMRFVEYFVNF